MHRHHFWLATIAIVLALLATTGVHDKAAAGNCESTEVTEWPASSGGNGHYYQGVCGDWLTGDDAHAASQAMGGNLVSITSADENDFVYALIDDPSLWSDEGGNWCPGPLIGAYQDPATQQPAANWNWTTGEAFGYTNWATGEPNDNAGVDENRAIFGNGSCVGLVTANAWHDVGEDDEEPSYVIEWEGAPPICANTAVTEWPASQGGNGHFYQGVCASDFIDWDDAEGAADGMGGYLATNTSSAENEFVFDLIDEPGFWNLTSYYCIVGPWIGGSQPAGSPEPDGDWEWVTGEPFVYDNWTDDEPDNFDEDDAIVFWGGCPELGRSPFWADLVSSTLGEVIAYVVEWDENPNPTPSPTPLGEQRIWGDNNCSGDAPNPVDGLLALRFDAGLSTNTGDCPAMGEVVEVGNASPHPWGDVDCSSEVSPVDSLKLLRFDAGLEVAQAAGCPELGSEVVISEA